MTNTNQSFSSLCHDYFAAQDGTKENASAVQALFDAITYVATKDGEKTRGAMSNSIAQQNYIPHHFNSVVEKRLPTVKVSKRPKSIAFQRFLTFKAMADKPVATVPAIESETVPAIARFSNGKADVVKYNGKLIRKNTQANIVSAMPGIEVNRKGEAMFSPNRHKNALNKMVSPSNILAQRHDEKTRVAKHYQRNHGVAIAEQLATLKLHHGKLTSQHIAATANGNFERASKLALQIAVNTAKMQEYAVKVAALLTK
jgi:hypothetical protein